MQKIERTASIGALCLALATFGGCSKESDSSTKTQSENPTSSVEINPRGYVEVSDSTYLIPGRGGSSLESQVQFAQAISNLLGDTTTRIIDVFRLDSHYSNGFTDGASILDGVALRVASVDSSTQTPDEDRISDRGYRVFPNGVVLVPAQNGTSVEAQAQIAKGLDNALNDFAGYSVEQRVPVDLDYSHGFTDSLGYTDGLILVLGSKK